MPRFGIPLFYPILPAAAIWQNHKSLGKFRSDAGQLPCLESILMTAIVPHGPYLGPCGTMDDASAMPMGISCPAPLRPSDALQDVPSTYGDADMFRLLVAVTREIEGEP